MTVATDVEIKSNAPNAVYETIQPRKAKLKEVSIRKVLRMIRKRIKKAKTDEQREAKRQLMGLAVNLGLPVHMNNNELYVAKSKK